MNLEHISLRLIEVWREKEKLNADLEAEEGRLLESNFYWFINYKIFINYIMSGGVPKRILISKTQANTPSKAGRWGKPGIILCGGARSRRAMCNSIQTRAKYCAQCPKSSTQYIDLLLINTIQNWQLLPDESYPDTVIFGYKSPSAPPIISDDVIQSTPPKHDTPSVNKPQNFLFYDRQLYPCNDAHSSVPCPPGPEANKYSSSLDIDLSTMNGGDTYRFIIMKYTTEIEKAPPYNIVSHKLGDDSNPITNLRINFGVAKNPAGNVLKVDPLTLQQHIGMQFPDQWDYTYLVIDLTLSADKKTVTHNIVT